MRTARCTTMPGASLRLVLDLRNGRGCVRFSQEGPFGQLPSEPQIGNEAVDCLLHERLRPVTGLKIEPDGFAQRSELGSQEPLPEPLGSPKLAVRTRSAHNATPPCIAIVTRRV
jgi:hypothetical protein